MGLDMYLERVTNKAEDEEIGYWRKDNHIHRWFVENVQDGIDDCGAYLVSREKLIELRKACLKVLQAKYDEKKRLSVASGLLPTRSGFFFGSTDYDEFYFDSLKRTLNILDEALDNTSGDQEIYYQASW